MAIERRTYAKATIAIVVVVVVGYFALGMSGALPAKYDLIRQYLTPSATNNTSAQTTTTDEPNEVTVSGIPTVVNLTSHNDNSYTLKFRCIAGAMDSMSVSIRVMQTNASVYLDGNYRWSIGNDGHSAHYIGRELSLYQETSTLTLHVDGDSTTTRGYVVISFDAPLTNIEADNLQTMVEV